MESSSSDKIIGFIIISFISWNKTQRITEYSYRNVYAKYNSSNWTIYISLVFCWNLKFNYSSKTIVFQISIDNSVASTRGLTEVYYSNGLVRFESCIQSKVITTTVYCQMKIIHGNNILEIFQNYKIIYIIHYTLTKDYELINAFKYRKILNLIGV